MHVVNNVTSNKLLPKYIGPFTVVKVCGTAYTLDIPSSMKTHPTFYVGRLKPYHTAESVLTPPEETILRRQSIDRSRLLIEARVIALRRKAHLGHKALLHDREIVCRFHGSNVKLRAELGLRLRKALV